MAPRTIFSESCMMIYNVKLLNKQRPVSRSIRIPCVEGCVLCLLNRATKAGAVRPAITRGVKSGLLALA